MHIDNEYEKLVRNGYIEEGTLIVHVDDITKMNLASEEVKPEDAKQMVRQDKSVVVIDKNGRMQKVSSLMFGYNKDKVKLGDGSFVNASELETAMKEAISRLDKGSYVIDKKGKILKPEDLLKVVEQTAGKIEIKERVNSITNQDSRYWSVTGAESNKEHKKGVVFLGNKGIQLNSGSYVSLEEFKKALNEYVVMKPNKKEETPVNKQQNNNPLVIRVVKKYKNQLSAILALLAALTVLASGFRLKDNLKNIDVPSELQTQIVQLIEQEQLNYKVNGIETNYTYESIKEAQKRIASNYKIGDEVRLDEGDKLYSNSLLEGKQAIIGKGIRQPGNYQISGVSIVCNGKIYASNVDLNIKDPGFDIGNFINETCKKYNLDLNDIEIRLHIGNNSNFTRTGWIDISKLIKEDKIDQQIISETTSIASTYDGIVNNFSGSSITINTLNGPVSIPVVDNNGNLLKSGTIVVGSDGQEYQVANLQIMTTQVEETKNVSIPVVSNSQEKTGKTLSWSIQDCNLALGIAPLVGAVAYASALKKKNEKTEMSPQFHEFVNEEEYQQFRREFIEAKKQYEKKSNFKKMINDLFYGKRVDFIQKLNEEQTMQLYNIIINLHDNNYSYQQGDHIELKNGRIIVTLNDGNTKDITNIVLPKIASIGSENKYDVSGRLEGDNKDGVHRR